MSCQSIAGPYLRIVAALLVLASTFSAPGVSLAAVPSNGPSQSLLQPPVALPPLKCEDVSLSREGLLSGQMLNAQGAPIAGANVWLIGSSSEPVAARTNQEGRFAYKGVRGGVYYLNAGESVRMCRVWTEQAAPPKSLSGMLMVAEEPAVRAQMGPPPLVNGFVQKSKRFFAHPVGMVALGAAIAVPIAIVASQGDDDPPATP